MIWGGVGSPTTKPPQLLSILKSLFSFCSGVGKSPSPHTHCNHDHAYCEHQPKVLSGDPQHDQTYVHGYDHHPFGSLGKHTMAAPVAQERTKDPVVHEPGVPTLIAASKAKCCCHGGCAPRNSRRDQPYVSQPQHEQAHAEPEHLLEPSPFVFYPCHS
jgi:hypothetical protein